MPFLFLTNGNQFYLWDRKSRPERFISGFFSRDELERIAHLRKFSEPLTPLHIEDKIGDRNHQKEAIENTPLI
ncbi:MAG: hypothetical protein KDK54_22270 [Leptospiraceae bacterium]|nr:hypothetical protein [Leptospiraceae bacterium]